MRKDFHLGDILSVTTDRLVSPSHMDGVYDILNYMTQDNLFTHQLPRASDQCRPWLLRWHPKLVDVDTGPLDDLPKADAQRLVALWLEEQVARFGEMLWVETIPVDDQTHRDPVEELKEMMPDKPIIVVHAGEEKQP